MALIRPSSVVGAISGSIGGVTFVNARRGIVARHRPTKILASSAAALKQQALFATITRAWTSLTNEQRSAWNALAIDNPTTNRLGITSSPSGFTLHARLNLLSLANQGPKLLDPPPVRRLYNTIEFTPVFKTSNSYFLFTQAPSGIFGLQIQVWAARHFSTTVPAFVNTWRLLGTALYSGLPSDGFQIFNAWTRIYGEMEEGEAYSVFLRALDPTALPPAGQPTQHDGVVQPP